jgi:hypothetical protein
MFLPAPDLRRALLRIFAADGKRLEQISFAAK